FFRAAFLLDSDHGIEDKDGQNLTQTLLSALRCQFSPNVTRRTYHRRVNECSPVIGFLKQGQDKGHSSGTEENQHELVLKLLEDELPQRCRFFVGQSCIWSAIVAVPRSRRQSGNLPFEPYFCLARC